MTSVTNPLNHEEPRNVTFVGVCLALGLAVMMAAAGYLCYELGRITGHADGWAEAWNTIQIENRPPAPLNLEDT